MKRISAIFLVLALLLVCPVATAEEEGMVFDPEYQYYTKELPAQLPTTYEATLKFPVDTECEDPNVIFGSYMTSTTSGLVFGVTTEGHPYLFLSNEDDGGKSASFTNVNVFTGEWIHLAITLDQATDTVTCYINGEAVDSMVQEFPGEVALHYSLGLATDDRSANRGRFKGALKNAALYSDLRTAQEIAADSTGTLDQDGLMMAYDLSAGGRPEVIPDKSGNKNDMILKSIWVADKKPAKDYSFSFAVLGDPQWLTNLHPEKLTAMFDWIEENIEEKNIKHLFTVGDLTHGSSDREWTNIWPCFDRLTGKLPYTVVRGNHDQAKDFKLMFDYSEYEETHGCFNENMLNSYSCFEVGDIPYMSMALDYNVSDSALEWANEVIAAHPDRNVIISTHHYLTSNGEIASTKENKNGNSGQEIWEKLIRKHENITLVLCGHVNGSTQIALSQVQGDCGNTVTQMMINPQSADHDLDGIGVVTMLYFSQDGRKVEVEHYSTDRKAFYLSENQFSFELDLLDKESSTPWLWIGIGGLLVIAVAAVSFFLLKKKKVPVESDEQ